MSELTKRRENLELFSHMNCGINSRLHYSSLICLTFFFCVLIEVAKFSLFIIFFHSNEICLTQAQKLADSSCLVILVPEIQRIIFVIKELSSSSFSSTSVIKLITLYFRLFCEFYEAQGRLMKKS